MSDAAHHGDGEPGCAAVPSARSRRMAGPPRLMQPRSARLPRPAPCRPRAGGDDGGGDACAAECRASAGEMRPPRRVPWATLPPRPDDRAPAGERRGFRPAPRGPPRPDRGVADAGVAGGGAADRRTAQSAACPGPGPRQGRPVPSVLRIHARRPRAAHRSRAAPVHRQESLAARTWAGPYISPRKESSFCDGGGRHPDLASDSAGIEHSSMAPSARRCCAPAARAR